jgi:tRNA threonylcarbamoyl adenosine modification protein (Sua5/YciO/YrdC/YwlC family)
VGSASKQQYLNAVDIFAAADIIRSGGLVAFPTETVFGLGANALSQDAVSKIFSAKGRPATNPLIVHVQNIRQSVELISWSPDDIGWRAYKSLTGHFWPGPLTLVVPSSSIVPSAVTAGTNLVGIRCPNHPVALSLIEASGVPIAAPSANKSGGISPTEEHHVAQELGDIPILRDNINAQTCKYGIESTVLKIDGKNKSLHILRSGSVTVSHLRECLHHSGLDDWGIRAACTSRRMISSGVEADESPGQALRHYSPSRPSIIVTDIVTDIATSISHVENDAHKCLPSHTYQINNQTLAQCVVIDFAGRLSSLKTRCLAYRDLSLRGSYEEAAVKLFTTLRWADNLPHGTWIILPDVSTVDDEAAFSEGHGPGVEDRIFRASSGQRRSLVIMEPTC